MVPLAWISLNRSPDAASAVLPAADSAAGAVVAALLPQALAAGLIETDRPVTLTVRFFHDKAPVSGAPFSLYRVADVSAYGEFTLTGDFKDDPVRLDDRSSDGWRALAETLRAFVLRDSRKPLDTGVTGSTGLLTFPNRQKTLGPGLYLLLGESFVSGGYSYTCLLYTSDAADEL